MATQQIRVQLLLTGNEIMSGDTVDSNSALIAQRLNELAIGIYRKVKTARRLAWISGPGSGRIQQANFSRRGWSNDENKATPV